MMSLDEMRPCAPEDTVKWIEFLNRNFGYQKEQSYGVDFAPYFEAQALQHSRLLWEGDQIASSASLYPVELYSFGKRYKLGIIGAVATDMRFRNRGYSSKIVELMVAQAQALSLDGVVLWSDQAEFYQKLGFAPVGEQKIYFLHEFSSVPPAPGVAAYGWNWSQVAGIYSSHPLRLERAPAQWAAIQKIRSCTKVQWLDPAGRTQAYLGFNRGKDMQGVIHEWGGDARALQALASQVLKNHPNLCWLTHPRLNDPIIKRLPETEKPMEGSLCLFKAIKPGFQIDPAHPFWFWGLDSL